MCREIWYRADFDYVPVNYGGGYSDYIYFYDDDCNKDEVDKQAIEWAKQRASEGYEFSGVGHVEMELVQVFEVNGEEECFPEIRQIWW